jgi:hypothetical protein
MTSQTIPNSPAPCIEDNAVIDPYNSQTTSTVDFANLNSSIQETLTAIDRFEWQVSEELRLMRDNRYYKDGGYTNFEDYCENELSKYGGYRRVRDLLAAKKVVDALPENLKERITKPAQTRPLLRLVKTPDKLHEAVAIAVQEKPFPTAADFAKAVQQVMPSNESTLKKEKSQTQLCQSVRISSQSHPRYGEEGVIETDSPNHWQQIVTLTDGEKLLVNNADLDGLSVPSSGERTYPAEYASAIASLKEQHKQELERLEQELRIGLLSDATARAEQQVQEELESLQQLFRQQKEQNLQLQQRLDEMEGLRQLELENQQLRQRILELEHAVEQRPQEQWGDTFTKGATKAQKGRTIDLRSLAIEPPKENAQECLLLMGMALKNLANAMNNTQALQAAAIILGSEPTPQAIAYRAEQLQLLPQAVSDIRCVLAKSECTWQDYWSVAQNYELIKQDYLAELTPQQIQLIDALEKADSQQKMMGDGSIVTHADPYSALHKARGEVIQDLGDEVQVAWEHWKDQPKKSDRYFKDELRLL